MFYGAAVFDPKLIISQIIALQTLFYIILGVTCVSMDILLGECK